MSMLGIYLNDHLAGATAGHELARRAASAHRDRPTGPALAQILQDIAEDDEALREIMTELEVPVRHYKVAAGWAAEKIGRLKLNGHLTDRSPLSDFLELEGLRLGVEGKLALWRTLRSLAEREPRLQTTDVDHLIARAEQQIAVLEDLRMATATHVFAST